MGVRYDVVRVLSAGSVTKPCVSLAQLQQQPQLQVVVRTSAALSPITARDSQEFSEQLQQLKQLRHRNVVRYYGGSLRGGEVTLVLSYLAGGSLGDYISVRGASGRPLEGQVVLSYLSQLAAGLQYCHQQQLVHGGLRSTCLFLDRPRTRLLIANFRITAVSSVPQPPGLSWCEAPELRAGDPHTRSSDMWAVGVILAEMLHMPAPPIFAKYPSRLSCSPALGELLLALLAEEPASRPPAGELKQRLDELITSSGGIEEVACVVTSSLKSAAIPSAVRSELIQKRAGRGSPSKKVSAGGHHPTTKTSSSASGRQAKVSGSSSTTGGRSKQTARSKQSTLGSSDRSRNDAAQQQSPSAAKSRSSTGKRATKNSSRTSTNAVGAKSLTSSSTGRVTKSPSIMNDVALSIGRELQISAPAVTSSVRHILGFDKSETPQNTRSKCASSEAGRPKRAPEIRKKNKTNAREIIKKPKTAKTRVTGAGSRDGGATVNKPSVGHKSKPSSRSMRKENIEEVEEYDSKNDLEEEEHELDEEELEEEELENDGEDSEEGEEDEDLSEEEEIDEEEESEEYSEEEDSNEEESLEEEESEEMDDEEEDFEENSEGGDEEEEDYDHDEFDGTEEGGTIQRSADAVHLPSSGGTTTLTSIDISTTAESSPVENREVEAPSCSEDLSPDLDPTGTEPLQRGKETDPLHERKGSEPLQREKETDPLHEGKGTEPLQRGKGADPLHEGKRTELLHGLTGNDHL